MHSKNHPSGVQILGEEARRAASRRRGNYQRIPEPDLRLVFHLKRGRDIGESNFNAPARVATNHGARRQLALQATPPLFLEYEDVLKRPEQRLAHGFALEAIEEFLKEPAALIEPVELHFRWRQLRDPNDEMVLEAAINGQADALVTYNVADFAAAANDSISLCSAQRMCSRR